MDNQPNLNLLSIGQASEYLGVSIDTLRRWEKKGKISSYRSPGGHRYFKKDELDMMFGKKYERSEETKPRKDYETEKKVEVIEEKIAEEVMVIEDKEDQEQEIVDTIISETEKVNNEIEDFFSRQPKNIDIPRLDPIRVKLVEEMPLQTVNQAVQYQTAVATPQPKLFTSFSQIGDQNVRQSKTVSKFPLQYILIIVAAVVAFAALAFGIIYFVSQPQIISPV